MGSVSFRCALIVSEWLTSIAPGQSVTTCMRNSFTAVAAGFTAEDWLKVQIEYDNAQALLRKSVDEERSANAVYQQVAPWGIVSSIFADDMRKRQIEPVKARRDAATSLPPGAEPAFDSGSIAAGRRWAEPHSPS